MSGPTSSPIEPLKDLNSHLHAQLKDDKGSIYKVASELESQLKELLVKVEESDKEINGKLEAITKRISHLEHSATEGLDGEKA